MHRDSDASVPPPRRDRTNVALTEFWSLLESKRREQVLGTLGRIMAKQLVLPPKQEEVDDE